MAARAKTMQDDLLLLEPTESATAGRRLAVSKFAERARAGGSREPLYLGSTLGHRAMDPLKTEAALAAPASGRMPGRCPAVGGSL